MCTLNVAVSILSSGLLNWWFERTWMQWVECLEARTKSFRRRREEKNQQQQMKTMALSTKTKEQLAICTSPAIWSLWKLIAALIWFLPPTNPDELEKHLRRKIRALRSIVLQGACFPRRDSGRKKGKRRHEISWKHSHWDRHSDMIAGVLQTVVICWPTFEQGRGDAILLPSL